MEGRILEKNGSELDMLSDDRGMFPENWDCEERKACEEDVEEIMAGNRKADKIKKNTGEAEKKEKTSKQGKLSKQGIPSKQGNPAKQGVLANQGISAKQPETKGGDDGALSPEEAVRQIRRDMQKEQYFLQCQYAIGIVEAKVKILDEQLAIKHHREIVRSVTRRIKTPESIYTKLVRKGLPLTFEAARERLNDLVGVRIVCLFVDDVYEIVNGLKRQKDVTVVKEKDYIAKPKKNGYMSFHLIVDIPVCFEEAQENRRVEIQIRTLAMDFWSVLEYQLMYKKNVSGSEKAFRELKNYSEEIAAMDRKMLHLRNQIDEI